MTVQVLVTGAGPTGLTLAVDLARRGIGVRIVERADRFPTGSRGDGIQPRTLEVFDDLGVLDAVLAAGIPQAPLRIHLDGAEVGERRMSPWREPAPDVPYPNPWVLGQAATEAILRARLTELGVEVESATALTEFTQDADGVHITLDGPHGRDHLRADYLVGADGGRSTVRKQLGIAFEGRTDESVRMLLADVTAAALDHDYGHWFATAATPADGIALTPLPGGNEFQLVAPLADSTATTRAALQDLLDRAGAAHVTLGEPGWATAWRANVRLAARFRSGRVFLAGDAAHVHPPTGGQGMNTGIQDAYNLGWKLAAALHDTPLPESGCSAQELLESYETERRTVAASVLGLSTDLLERTRTGGAGAFERGENTHQLGIGYRAPGATGTLIAGDRAPDAPLRRLDGTPVRLFDLFRGPHATVLEFGATIAAYACSPTEPRRRVELGRFHPVGEHATTAYAATPGTRTLVRPDGYLAWRQDDPATGIGIRDEAGR